ncbi:prephenate dehydratase [Candidatus Micrarchaeota archaeon]|nr:prephenate dehydratase [Candidatus Micrarchaeota archaeon]
MTLEKSRGRIDEIDEQITKLLAERVNVAKRTRKEKQVQGQGVTDASREKNVLEHVERVAKEHGLDPNLALRVFEEIMAASKAQQYMDHDAPTTERLDIQTVAFQGERGAYSEEALRQILPNADPVPRPELGDVFDEVQKGKADAGLVPIENSTEGSINYTYDLLLDSQLGIAGETFLRVRHCLLAKSGTKTREGLHVYSHPQALAQCRDFLIGKKLQPVQYYDTAGAAKAIAEGKIQGAAIASKTAAEHYGLDVLAEGIEDNRNNYTRFILISKNTPTPTDSDKTSIVFSTHHRPGALFEVMKVFAKADINLTKLESRPTKQKPWEYFFYMDFEGTASKAPYQQALENIKPHTLFLKVLGSYPRSR